jgi:transcription initiation factor IIE alpha subunit
MTYQLFSDEKNNVIYLMSPPVTHCHDDIPIELKDVSFAQTLRMPSPGDKFHTQTVRFYFRGNCPRCKEKVEVDRKREEITEMINEHDDEPKYLVHILKWKN